MDSNCRKLGETPYRECRKQAAIYNDALGSMERAAEMLGVSVNTVRMDGWILQRTGIH